MRILDPISNVIGIIKLAMTGDSLGGSSLELLNRAGVNGARLTTTMDNAANDLIDIVFVSPTRTSNIRLEGRAANTTGANQPEWQFGTAGTPHTVMSTSGLEQKTGYIKASATGIKFNDNTVQTTAATSSATLTFATFHKLGVD